MPSAPPDALIERFRNAVDALAPGQSGARFGLAVSGGPDSLALLLLAQASLPHVLAATVDHGLRPAGAQEAGFVASICSTLGVPHETLVLGAPDKGNISDWARRERYAALADWTARNHIDFLMTAHHADDQLETMIMRLNRGSGVAGLSGIRARRGSMIRPLLGWQKRELEALCQDCGVTPVDDPSNRDDRFDRARLRKALVDALWLDRHAAVRSAAALAQAEEALDWTARRLADDRIVAQPDAITLAPEDVPHELLRRLVILAMQHVSPDASPRGDDLERLIAALNAGRVATLAGVKCSGGTLWRFSPAPPHRKI